MKRWLGLILVLVAAPSFAIFTNGGFETNSFAGWTKTIGTNPGLTGAPPFNGTNIVVGAGGSDTSAIVGAGVDALAPLLVLPRVGSFTARVNDSANGAIINSIKQSAPITAADRDPSDSLLHVRFSYAAVLEDPGHSPDIQPYFYVVVRNLTKATIVYQDFTYSNQPGKTFLTGPSGWLYTNFINVDVVIPDLDLGDTIEIETLAADCAAGGHGGYVYLDGFGSAVVGPGGPQGVVAVPTLSEMALYLLIAMTLGAALLKLRRKV
ncbi:MAG: hypothetical protein ABI607_12260 [Betaproteobacteria bacterium]